MGKAPVGKEKPPVKVATEKKKPSLTPEEIRKRDQKASKQAHYKRIRAFNSLHQALNEKYPTVFNDTKPLPLGLGVHKEIKAVFPQFSQKIIRQFLNRWVNNSKYLLAVINIPSRFDINGAELTPISEQSKNFAIEVLAKKVADGHDIFEEA